MSQHVFLERNKKFKPCHIKGALGRRGPDHLAHLYSVIGALKGLDSLCRFCFLLYKGDNFGDSLFAFSPQEVSSRKGSTLKRKNSLQKGTDSFPLE